ncbi:MAG: GNAT family N-acetyltransferase [Bacteroidales bacterium]|nr:GNAT family N-acetyltransferase [Bacteroidales bacterium]
MKYSEKLPTTEQFFDLFETTDWNTKYELTKEELFTALKNSWYSISVFDNEQLIGFGRIICDSIVHALILDVIIIPERQGEGIGKEIMEKLVSECKKHKIRDIQLFSAKDKAGFYEKLGFECRPEDDLEWNWKNIGKN